MTIRQEVRLARRLRELSQYELAVRTGGVVSQTEICSFEKGYRPLPEHKLKAILRVLNIKSDEV